VIYEYGEPWWNDIEREKLIRPRELSGKPTSSHLLTKEEELAKEVINFASRNTLPYIDRCFNMP
jgi:hypothetical protein